MYRGNLKLVQILTAGVITVVLGLAGPSLAKKGGGGKPPPDPPPPTSIDPVIVYVDGGSIFATDADGSNQLPVLARTKGKRKGGITYYSSPAWSPDGRHVVFRGAEGLYTIELIPDPDDPDGNWSGATSERQLIFEGSVHTPAWHPNGQQIAFVSVPAGTGGSDVFLINVDGTGLVNLTNTPYLNEYSLSWSPDGNRLATAETFWTNPVFEDVVVYDLDGGSTINQKTTVTSQQFSTINGISWSKVADQPNLIAFGASAPGGTYSQIWCIPVDDPTPAQMLTTNVDEAILPSWSSNDNQLVTRQHNALSVFDLDYSQNPNGCPNVSSEQDIVDSGTTPDWRR